MRRLGGLAIAIGCALLIPEYEPDVLPDLGWVCGMSSYREPLQTSRDWWFTRSPALVAPVDLRTVHRAIHDHLALAVEACGEEPPLDVTLTIVDGKVVRAGGEMRCMLRMLRDRPVPAINAHVALMFEPTTVEYVESMQLEERR